MRTIGLLVALAALASEPASADVVRRKSIPESFRGTWAPSAQACDKRDESVIVVSARSYVVSQSSCAVDWVSKTPGASGSIYSARMSCSATAEPARKTISNLLLSRKDANQISVGSEFGSLKVYQRCATSEPAAQR